MLRSSFFAAGLFVFMAGASFLMVDKLTLTLKDDTHSDPKFRGMFTTNAERQRVIDPPEWAAFSLMSIGSVTMLYAVALPKQNG